MEGPRYAQSDPKGSRPFVTKRGIDLWLRWLGILLPLAALWGFLSGNAVPVLATAIVSLALWVGFTVALAVRRDWRGALAISVIYVILSGSWLVIILVFHGLGD